MINYLNNGGNLYIESVNLGFDYYTTTFFDYFGIKYNDDGSDEEVIYLSGDENDLTSGLQFEYLGGHDAHYSIDRLGPYGGELLLGSEDGHGRMYLNEEGNFKVISSSILLGAIASNDSLNLKPYLVSEMVNYFLNYNPVTTLKENFADLFSVRNFPNPFKVETKIEYTIQKAGPTTIRIYNANGQLIKQLIDEDILPGNYTVAWDATNMNGESVKKGFYFYRISQGEKSVTEKILFLE